MKARHQTPLCVTKSPFTAASAEWHDVYSCHPCVTADINAPFVCTSYLSSFRRREVDLWGFAFVYTLVVLFLCGSVKLLCLGPGKKKKSQASAVFNVFMTCRKLIHACIYKSVHMSACTLSETCFLDSSNVPLSLTHAHTHTSSAHSEL